jgi:tRNA (guanine-N7-)-methyltransferase
MGRAKLKRFAVVAENRNVIEPGKDLFTSIRGHWHEYFGNQNDIVLELGCGRGEYSTGLGALNPDKNYVGIDLKGARLWKGSVVAVENNLHNVAFLRTQIQNIASFFAENEVSEIWITFPDPRPKDSDEKRRLTSPRFLALYRSIMKKGGVLNFKTDNLPLFEYTLDEVFPAQAIENLEFTKDLYTSSLLALHHQIQTTFEKHYLKNGEKINYLRCVLV